MSDIKGIRTINTIIAFSAVITISAIKRGCYISTYINKGGIFDIITIKRIVYIDGIFYFF